MRRIHFPPLLGLLLLLSACADGGGADPSGPPVSAPTPSAAVSAPPVSAATPAPLAPVWGERFSECSQTEEDGTLLVSGRFSLPFIENADGNAAYTAINDYYLDLSAGLRSDTLLNAPQAADDHALALALEYEFIPYFDEESHLVTYTSGGVASILRTHYGSTGGPYPAVLYLTDRFDLATGAPLAFADCFADPAEAETVILEELARQGGDEVEGRFQRESFCYSGEGLVFYFQSDPGAPHASAGDAESYTVSYELLGDTLLRR